jgi:hypothetical protein
MPFSLNGGSSIALTWDNALLGLEGPPEVGGAEFYIGSLKRSPDESDLTFRCSRLGIIEHFFFYKIEKEVFIDK